MHAALASPSVFLRAPVEYRGFTLVYDLPPIPGGEKIAWRFYLDAETDEFGGAGPSIEDCRAQIDAILAEAEADADELCDECGGDGAYWHDGRTPQHPQVWRDCALCGGTGRAGGAD